MEDRLSVKRGSTIPAVSVVVPTRNSAQFLEACLHSIHVQSFPVRELIVCDNSSTDQTVDIARRCGATVLNAGPERSAQRNTAARYAQGDVLLFIDSDMRLRASVVSACVQCWQSGANVIIIPEVVVGNRFWARARAFDKLFGAGVPGYEAARFIDRRLFLAAGGYDERLTVGEDFDLHLSLLEAGGSEGRVTSAIEHLEFDLSLKDYIRKWQYYAQLADPFIAKRGAVRSDVIALPRLVRQRWHLGAHDPLGFLGFLLLKGIEYSVIGRHMRQGARAMRHGLRAS